MSDADEGLARIDAMLEDYIPPSHLALVPTPEEAEALGRDPEGPDPFTQGGSFGAGSYSLHREQAELYMRAVTAPRPQTQNTYALLDQVINSRIRSEHELRERRIMQVIYEQVQACFDESVEVSYQRDSMMWRTDIIATSESIQVRWSISEEDLYRHMRFEGTVDLVLNPRDWRTRGSDWCRFDPQRHELLYVSIEEEGYIEQLRAIDGQRFMQSSMRQHIVALRPIRVRVPPLEGEQRASPQLNGVRGQHAHFVVMDETVSLEPTAAEIQARSLDITPYLADDEIIIEEADAIEEVVDDSRSRRERRHNLNAQQSTYGPPPRGRRR